MKTFIQNVFILVYQVNTLGVVGAILGVYSKLQGHHRKRHRKRTCQEEERTEA